MPRLKNTNKLLRIKNKIKSFVGGNIGEPLCNSLLSGNKIYSIELPDIELNDTTGIGDIFSAAFCCTMLKEKDILWALSFAGGAAQAALESGKIGLEKIPSKGAIESNAYYFYNTVRFKEI